MFPVEEAVLCGHAYVVDVNTSTNAQHRHILQLAYKERQFEGV